MDTNGSKTLLALGQRLPGLLKRLRAAASSAATVAQQLEAFSDGCEILSEVVDWLDKEKAHIKSLEAALGQFLLSIPKSKLDEFLMPKRNCCARLAYRTLKSRQCLRHLGDRASKAISAT